MKTILAPIDFSRVTPHVVAEAADLAVRLNGHLMLLNVAKPRSRRDNSAAFLRTMQNLIGHRLQPLVEKQRRVRSSAGEPAQVSGDSIQLIGEPVTKILEQITKLSADFVVMGSHGRSAFHDVVFGSVAAGVMKHASCPVIIVPSLQKSVGVKKRNLGSWMLVGRRGENSRTTVSGRTAHWREKPALSADVEIQPADARRL